MRNLFTIFIIINLILNVTQSTFAANLEAGEQIFTENCSACHPGGTNAIMPDKTLKKEKLEENSMNSILAITTQVRQGKNAMPAFGGRLADEDIDNVANYVLKQSEQGW